MSTSTKKQVMVLWHTATLHSTCAITPKCKEVSGHLVSAVGHELHSNRLQKPCFDVKGHLSAKNYFLNESKAKSASNTKLVHVSDIMKPKICT